jgi:hypothetical protein
VGLDWKNAGTLAAETQWIQPGERPEFNYELARKEQRLNIIFFHGPNRNKKEILHREGIS